MIETRPLHPLFAAEAVGVDLSRPLDDKTIAGVVAALDEYAVLVFRGQALTDAAQVAFSKRLGPVALTRQKDRPGQKLRLDERVSDISNLTPEGTVMAADDRRRMDGLANRLWHTDHSFRRVPAKYSLLAAYAVPSVGGETEFADMRAAWDALPEAQQRALEGLVAEHSLFESRAKIGFADFSAEERAALPPVPQVLVRTHPGSRRKSLYLASHAARIRGMPEPEGRMLLLDLTEHATRRRFVYSHEWRVGDFVIWDNRCTMHRARAFDMGEPRDMRRTTVSDAGPTVEQAGAA